MCTCLQRQKKAWDPLELKLQVVVSLLVGLGTEFTSSERAAGGLSPDPKARAYVCVSGEVCVFLQYVCIVICVL